MLHDLGQTTMGRDGPGISALRYYWCASFCWFDGSAMTDESDDSVRIRSSRNVISVLLRATPLTGYAFAG